MVNKRKSGKSWGSRGNRPRNRHSQDHNHNHRDHHEGDFNRQRSHIPHVQRPSYPNEDSGLTLDRIVELFESKKTKTVLDLTSGVGHTGLAIAPKAEHVFICDEKSNRFREARDLIQSRGLKNVTTLVAEFDNLPFKNGTFDAVVARATANRFQDVRLCMKEIARVTGKGGRVIIVDNLVPTDTEVDRFLNQIESTQNPAHVRYYNAKEWKVLLADAGLKVKALEEDVVEDEGGGTLNQWLNREGLNPVVAKRITGMLISANRKIKDAVNFRVDLGEIYVQPRKVLVVGGK